MAQPPDRKVKHYVDVIARMRDDGLVTPLAVCWGDGSTYQVEQVLRPSPVTLPPKGRDDPVLVQEYRVRAMGHVTKLYLERDRSLPGMPAQWYVMVSPTKLRLEKKGRGIPANNPHESKTPANTTPDNNRE